MFTIVNLHLYTFVVSVYTMTSKALEKLHKTFRESRLFGRYIHLDMLIPIIKDLGSNYEVKTLGTSVKGNPIHSIQIGSGSIKVLMWSQMHGNESTTTKAIFDMFNAIEANSEAFQNILANCTLCIIPMLNPDGAALYTRLNANGIDLNRDSQDLSQSESQVLRMCFETFKPDYCFNLHGQRTIFGVGNTGKVATVSFLAPAQDEERTVTPNRAAAMAVISYINTLLNEDIPGQIGIYDDSFNINCVGDAFQAAGVPTILFEAGHYHNDYDREKVRQYIFKAMYWGLEAISSSISINKYEKYFDIPENTKSFYDILIKNGRLSPDSTESMDVAIQFKETLDENTIKFQPIVEKIEDLSSFFAHKTIDAQHQVVSLGSEKILQVDYEIDFVFINDQKILIKS